MRPFVRTPFIQSGIVSISAVMSTLERMMRQRRSDCGPNSDEDGVNSKGEPHMVVSARSMTSRIADAVQAVIAAANRLIEEVAPAPRPQLVPVRVRSRSQGPHRR